MKTAELKQIIESFGFSNDKNKLSAGNISVSVIDLNSGESFGYK